MSRSRSKHHCQKNIQKWISMSTQSHSVCVCRVCITTTHGATELSRKEKENLCATTTTTENREKQAMNKTFHYSPLYAYVLAWPGVGGRMCGVGRVLIKCPPPPFCVPKKWKQGQKRSLPPTHHHQWPRRFSFFSLFQSPFPSLPLFLP